MLFRRRYGPPQRSQAGQQQARAVELVEQQVVLGAAAALGGQAERLAALEALGVEHEEVHFEAGALRMFFDAPGLLAQQSHGVGGQLRIVHEPDVEIAVTGIGDGSGAAHQVETTDGIAPLHPVFVYKRAHQLARSRGGGPPGRVVADARRGFLRHIARQQRMVDVKQQRHQLDIGLLARMHGFEDAPQAIAIDRHEPLFERLFRIALDCPFRHSPRAPLWAGIHPPVHRGAHAPASARQVPDSLLFRTQVSGRGRLNFMSAKGASARTDHQK